MNINHPKAETDAEVMRQALAKPHAFVRLFEQHFDAVHAYACRRVGPDLGEEIAAETFARAFDRRSTYDGAQASARPWLLGITTNLIRRHWRSERRRLAAYGRAATDNASASNTETTLPADLVLALKALPRREREPLLLFAWADLTYEEIATALACPLGTVRSRIARGRRRLRKRLGADELVYWSSTNEAELASTKESTNV